ncbi:MAG: C-GCAxxG-C-C family protein [Lachnospiraceae bacterium]|nr:C-GCAxxG-C-C family protein [Lachnospiraceae bacterium]
MGSRADKAVDNHKHFYTCSASVLAAFADQINIDEANAKEISKPFAGGRMGKCGAVLSAEYVLKEFYKDDADAKIEEFEDKFKAADKGSVICMDLRGKVPGSCRACVTDAARILEEMLG